MEILRVIVQLGTQGGARGPVGEAGGKESQRPGLSFPHCDVCSPGLCQPPAIHNRPHLYAALCSIKAHLGFQLVQGSPVLIRVRQGVPIPRGGQEGVTWTMLRAHLDVMASVTT